ncbi:MAG: hypothetical protein AAB403_15995 [Planctomycetota bacterium]
MRLILHTGLLAAGAIAMLTGCEPNQLYLGSRTVVGINASVNPELNSGSLVVGYDRMFATVIPVVQKDQPQEAMTSIACSSLLVKGVTIKRFTESIATGPAAATFAGALNENDPKPVKDFFDCFKKTKGVTQVTVAPAAGDSK